MNEDRMFTAWFAVCAVLALAWMSFVVWAIYQLVTWVTAR